MPIGYPTESPIDYRTYLKNIMFLSVTITSPTLLKTCLYLSPFPLPSDILQARDIEMVITKISHWLVNHWGHINLTSYY